MLTFSGICWLAIFSLLAYGLLLGPGTYSLRFGVLPVHAYDAKHGGILAANSYTPPLRRAGAALRMGHLAAFTEFLTLATLLSYMGAYFGYTGCLHHIHRDECDLERLCKDLTPELVLQGLMAVKRQQLVHLHNEPWRRRASAVAAAAAIDEAGFGAAAAAFEAALGPEATLRPSLARVASEEKEQPITAGSARERGWRERVNALKVLPERCGQGDAQLTAFGEPALVQLKEIFAALSAAVAQAETAADEERKWLSVPRAGEAGSAAHASAASPGEEGDASVTERGGDEGFEELTVRLAEVHRPELRGSCAVCRVCDGAPPSRAPHAGRAFHRRAAGGARGVLGGAPDADSGAALRIHLATRAA